MKDVRRLDRKVFILDGELKEKVLKKCKRLTYHPLEIAQITIEEINASVFGFTAYIFGGTATTADIRKIIASIPEGCSLLIFNEKLITAGLVINGINVVTSKELKITVSLVSEVFKCEGIRVSSQDAGYISQLTSNASHNGFVELEKIINYIKAGGTVKGASNITVQKENFNTFNIINMVLDGRSAEAVSYLYWMVSNGYEERMIIGALVWFFRKIVAIKYYNGSLDQQTLYNKIGVRFNGHKFVRYAMNNNLQSLRKRIKSLKLADLTLKTSDSNVYAFLCKAIL